MDKNIKKIIAMTLAICSVLSVSEMKVFDSYKGGIIPAYAADKDSLDLEDISLSKGDISFSKDTLSYKVYLNRAVKEIKIAAQPEGSDKRVRVTIGGEGVSEDDSYEHKFKLSVGENVFDIVIEDKKDESRKKTYKLTVYRGTDENGQDIEQDIYLEHLTVNGEEINLSKDKKVYDYKVDKSVKEARVVIEPDQDYYKVKIDDKTYENEESIKKVFTLSEGKNEIKIKLTDGEDDEKKQRTYTLNIYRGVDIPSTTTSSSTTTSNTTNNKTNVSQGNSTSNNNANTTTSNTSAATVQTSETGKWQQSSNGKWHYLDKNGNLAKNTWFFVQEDGTIATGWISFGGNWYYLNDEGAMATGWLSNAGKWYYLGSDGAMKTGWVEVSGKWYYLNSDGSMASNTTISGYKLGSDGAWIK
ncbi:MAG: cadherin-like beta sandwich domain-containing protein [Clostridium sp.]